VKKVWQTEAKGVQREMQTPVPNHGAVIHPKDDMRPQAQAWRGRRVKIPWQSADPAGSVARSIF